MTKRQLIDDIRRYNTSAQAQFLEQFDEEALQQYLDALQGAANKRLRYGRITPEKPARFRMVS